MPGKIIKIISNLYTVKVGDNIYECRARGKFRNENITPLVGDNCLIDTENNYILEIQNRSNYLNRPAVANIDYAVILTSVKKPNLSLNLLDKMLSIVILNKIKPIICFSKLDLLERDEKKNIKNLSKYYQKIGIPVVFNNELRKLKKLLKGKVAVFTGQTGAGKSTLLNHLDKSLSLKTGEISEALGRGKHTTRHVELFEVEKCFLVDTPGFSALDINAFTPEEIRFSFQEFANYPCKFPDCQHKNEKDCAVRQAVLDGKILKTRYENYLNFIEKK